MAKTPSPGRAQRRAVQRAQKSLLVEARRDVRVALGKKRGELAKQGINVDDLQNIPGMDLDFEIKVTDPLGRDITHEAIIE